MKGEKLFGVVIGVLSCVVILVALGVGVTKVVSSWCKDFENLKHTELMYDQYSNNYYIEIDGVKQGIVAFGPTFRDDSDPELVLMPGKEVVCFEYSGATWVYPKSVFYSDNIKMCVFKEEVYTWVVLTITFVGLGVMGIFSSILLRSA